MALYTYHKKHTMHSELKPKLPRGGGVFARKGAKMTVRRFWPVDPIRRLFSFWGWVFVPLLARTVRRFIVTTDNVFTNTLRRTQQAF